MWLLQDFFCFFCIVIIFVTYTVLQLMPYNAVSVAEERFKIGKLTQYRKNLEKVKMIRINKYIPNSNNPKIWENI